MHKVSIVQRGIGTLGHTLQLPLEEHYVSTRRELVSQLTVLLAGRAAEQVGLREVSTGAQNDLLRATFIARAMVTEYGMSDALGPVNYVGPRRPIFLEPYASERGACAEDTARRIDEEVQRLITEADDEARRILAENRGVLDALAHHLLDKEVVEGAELRAMLQQAHVRPGAQANESETTREEIERVGA